MPGEFLLDVVTLGPLAIVPAFLLAVISGMVAALIGSREERGLRRAPYLAFTAIIAMVSAGLALAWSFIPADRLPWLFALPFIGLHLWLGWLLGKFAIARAIDAWNIRGRGWLAIVPLAHFGLYLVPPRDPEAAPGLTPWKPLAGNGGVAAGLVAIVLGFGLAQIASLNAAGAFDEGGRGLHLHKPNSPGLAINLQLMAVTMRFINWVDDGPLLAVEARGNTLIITRDFGEHPDRLAIRRQAAAGFCSAFAGIFGAGAELQLRLAAGEDAPSINLNRERCEAIQNPGRKGSGRAEN
ncbi:MAG: hypothetical protein KDJ53_06845 [Rhodobiaceae bacterium]|nr:hypothetical protein [Rhodobiaceae bacterium]